MEDKTVEVPGPQIEKLEPPSIPPTESSEVLLPPTQKPTIEEPSEAPVIPPSDDNTPKVPPIPPSVTSKPPTVPPVPPPPESVEEVETIEPPAAPPVPPPPQEEAVEADSQTDIDDNTPAPVAPPRKASLAGNSIRKASVTGDVPKTGATKSEGAKEILKSIGADISTAQAQAQTSAQSNTIETSRLAQLMECISIEHHEARRNTLQVALGGQASFATDEYIVKEANLDKYNRWNKTQTRYFILTTKRLIYGKWKDETHFKVLNILPLGILQAQLAEDKERVQKGVDTFILLSYDKSFHVKSLNNNVKENEEWVKLINKASALDRGTDGTDMAIALWDVRKNDPDIDVTKCFLCDRDFGFINRRHHCRRCGHCVCQSCSNQKIVFAMDSRYVPVRVCRSCAAEVKDNRKYGVTQHEDNFDLYGDLDDDDDNEATTSSSK